MKQNMQLYISTGRGMEQKEVNIMSSSPFINLEFAPA